MLSRSRISKRSFCSWHSRSLGGAVRRPPPPVVFNDLLESDRSSDLKGNVWSCGEARRHLLESNRHHGEWVQFISRSPHASPDRSNLAPEPRHFGQNHVAPQGGVAFDQLDPT